MEMWKHTLSDIQLETEEDIEQVLFQIIHTLYFMQKYLRLVHCDLHSSNILARENCPPENRVYRVNEKFYKILITIPCALNDFGFAYSETLFTNPIDQFCKMRSNSMLVEMATASDGKTLSFLKPLFLTDLFKILLRLKKRYLDKFDILNRMFDYVERIREQFVHNTFLEYQVSERANHLGIVIVTQLVPKEMYTLKPDFFEDLLDRFFSRYEIKSTETSSSSDIVYGGETDKDLKMYFKNTSHGHGPIWTLLNPEPDLTKSLVEQFPLTFLEFPKRPFELDIMNWKEIEPNIEKFTHEISQYFRYATREKDVFRGMVHLFLRYGTVRFGVNFEQQCKYLAVLLAMMNPSTLELMDDPVEMLTEDGFKFVLNFYEKSFVF